MAKIVFKKKKAQLLANFTSVTDLISRFEKAGFNATIRNREHNFDYELTQDGFLAGKFKLKDPPEPKLGEIDDDPNKDVPRSREGMILWSKNRLL